MAADAAINIIFHIDTLVRAHILLVIW